MNILHTSDWHLGQNFRDKDRQNEHRRFFDWLLGCISEHEIDLLIVAGDIFDTVAPPNYARQLLFSFLKQVLKTNCRYVIIVGGNHDSVTNLNAPKEILELLNVYVIGGMCESIDDEIIAICNTAGDVEALVCAVPYLRDRDIRKSIPGESYDAKRKAILTGVREHYQQVVSAAVAKRQQLELPDIPIIATGHLFAAGGQHSEGEREIYIGGEGKIDVSSFPAECDYVALGHLHKPQIVGGCDHIRYSGSPIPLSFSEARTTKQVVKVTFPEQAKVPEIETIAIPEFQKLRVFKGSMADIQLQIEAAECDEIWAEFHFDADEYVEDLEGRINSLIEETEIQTFAIKDLRKAKAVELTDTGHLKELAEVTPEEVFAKRLEIDDKCFSPEQVDELTAAFKEILQTVHEKELDE